MSVKVSVIIPCYNHAHFLMDAVESLLAQSYEDWECIIVNDGSTDDTETVAISLCARDERINYLGKENGGLSSARNAGLDIATGDYIQFLDADDMLDAQKFSLSLEQCNEADIVMSDFIFFTENGGVQTKPAFKLSQHRFNFQSILSGWDSEFVFPPNCGLFKAHLFTGIRFSEELTAREDWLMWLQIYLHDVQTVFVDEPLALYRLLPNSMSKNKVLMDENQVSVFKILYKIVPDKHHHIFFEKVINTFGRILAEKQNIIEDTRISKSFRIGNFLVRNFNKLTGRANSNPE
jgi:glycosyltransferase involved in cell wall biosynthesis